MDEVLWLSLLRYCPNLSRCSGRQNTPDAHFRAAPLAKLSALSASGHTSGSAAASVNHTKTSSIHQTLCDRRIHVKVYISVCPYRIKSLFCSACICVGTLLAIMNQWKAARCVNLCVCVCNLNKQLCLTGGHETEMFTTIIKCDISISAAQ